MGTAGLLSPSTLPPAIEPEVPVDIGGGGANGSDIPAMGDNNKNAITKQEAVLLFTLLKIDVIVNFIFLVL